MEKLYSILNHAHSGLRWVVLGLLLYAIFNALTKKSGNLYSEGDRKLNLFTMISAHTQLLLGLILYFISPKVHFGAGMMVQPFRFFTVEHTLGMLIALVLITIGHAKSKRAAEASKKHKTIFTFYLIALVIILACIPWPFREILGGKWA